MCREQFAKDVDRAVFPGVQGGPLVHVIAAKAVCLHEAMQPAFVEYQRQVLANAQVLAETLLGEGFRLVSGGTDNHLMLVDVAIKGITGKDAERALEKANITVNKNVIPFDTKALTITSGIRIGSPAVTTRGMKEPEMKTIGLLISRVLHAPDDENTLRQARDEVLTLTDKFPLYPEKLAALGKE